MDLVELVWLIPALPLAGFLALLAFGKRLGEPAAGWLAVAAMGGSFAATVVTFVGLSDLNDRSYSQILFEWLPSGGLTVDMGFLVDPLSITMALFVTGVATLIFIYSVGYMHGDPDYAKFFLYLCLFAFSMLMLVLGNSLLVTFLGWEGVGLCSYLLVAFWFGSDANASAGKKAFVTNRVGDWGFMVAMFLAFLALGSLDYEALTTGAGGLATSTATAISLLLFVGAVGKSAQLPLYIWLPDAMAGPTPVSAMLHAATMVTAGVYLMVRINPVIEAAAPSVGTIIAVVGALTALFAATIAVGQDDIKKVLAYSTVSQLGYMFLAIGSGAYVAAVFHMVTHAMFKALLFLGAGSVIHGMDDEQDMRRMGGLVKLMPITAITFMVGWLAIAGIPPFSGFWSKDEILAFVYQDSPVLWMIGFVTAGLTAYYMSRQVFLVFWGKPRWQSADAQGEPEQSAEAVSDEETAAGQSHQGHPTHVVHPHESPWTMTAPLVVLAILALFAGLANLPFEEFKFLEHWLEPVLVGSEAQLTVPGATQIAFGVATTLLCLFALLAARAVYLNRRIDPERAEPDVLARGWYYDSTVSAFMGGPGRKLFDAVAWVFDRKVVDGAVNGLATVVRDGGRRLRVVQSGYVRNYALGLTLGTVAVIAFFLTRVTL